MSTGPENYRTAADALREAIAEDHPEWITARALVGIGHGILSLAAATALSDRNPDGPEGSGPGMTQVDYGEWAAVASADPASVRRDADRARAERAEAEIRRLADLRTLLDTLNVVPAEGDALAPTYEELARELARERELSEKRRQVIAYMVTPRDPGEGRTDHPTTGYMRQLAAADYGEHYRDVVQSYRSVARYEELARELAETTASDDQE